MLSSTVHLRAVANGSERQEREEKSVSKRQSERKCESSDSDVGRDTRWKRAQGEWEGGGEQREGRGVGLSCKTGRERVRGGEAGKGGGEGGMGRTRKG